MHEDSASTRFAVSTGGVRVAYDVSGVGPALVLLHGGGQTRRVWHELGYVARLRDQFTVVTLDIRGNGESDAPPDAASYAIDRLVEDVLAVADAAGASRLALWGFSYGGNIGRAVAATSDRLASFVMVGVPFGDAAPGIFRTHALAVRAKWTPVIEAHHAGTLDLATLADADRIRWEAGNVEIGVAQLGAILDWPPVEPAAMRCPTLWVVGTANEIAMASVAAYQPSLAPTRVTVQLLPGLTHERELTSVDDVMPVIRPFLSA